MVKNLIERVVAELPMLDPSKTRNSTPGLTRQIELRDSDGGVIDTIDVLAGQEDSWIGMRVSDIVVASYTDVTPQEKKDQEMKDNDDVEALEGLSQRLAAIEARLTALENR